jgi:hemerythrin
MKINEKIPWDDAYSIGIERIDTQHKHLFYLVNQLYVLEDNGDIKEQMRQILYEFNSYTLTHFKDEEIYMASIGYPELEHHKELHKNIIESLAKIIHTPATLHIVQSKMKIVAKRVLIEHILHQDSKIKLYQLNSPKIDEDVIDITNV